MIPKYMLMVFRAEWDQPDVSFANDFNVINTLRLSAEDCDYPTEFYRRETVKAPAGHVVGFEYRRLY